MRAKQPLRNARGEDGHGLPTPDAILRAFERIAAKGHQRGLEDRLRAARDAFDRQSNRSKESG